MGELGSHPNRFVILGKISTHCTKVVTDFSTIVTKMKFGVNLSIFFVHDML